MSFTADKSIDLSAGTIRYRELGTGDPIVFVHGLLVDGTLWRKVAPALAERHRVIVPDLPLGSHRTPMRPDADLTPPALAALLAEFIEKLGLENVTLVGNDTGGALSQMVVTRHPERVARLVLTSCDAFETFPPKIFAPLKLVARVPAATRAIAGSLAFKPLRRLPGTFGWLTKRPVPDDVVDGWLEPLRSDAGVRRDVQKVILGIDPRYTLEAGARLKEFDRPVLIAWAADDKLFKRPLAERLAAAFPNARLELVPDSYTFVPEDQPEHLARLIDAFVAEGAPVTA